MKSLEKKIPIRPAATVMIMREGGHGLEVLLLKRNKKLRFAPGAWVFPGGRIEKSELDQASSLQDSALLAAVRETHEECGLILQPGKLQHYCHWTTPAGGPKRFGTWFFHTLAAEDHREIRIDDSEIVEYQWLTPLEALQQHQLQRLPLLPPTFISLHRVKYCADYQALNEEFFRTGVIKAAPVVHALNGKTIIMYRGDAGYQRGDATLRGPRHRLTRHPNGRYQFEFSNCNGILPVTGGVDLSID